MPPRNAISPPPSSGTCGRWAPLTGRRRNREMSINRLSPSDGRTWMPDCDLPAFRGERDPRGFGRSCQSNPAWKALRRSEDGWPARSVRTASAGVRHGRGRPTLASTGHGNGPISQSVSPSHRCHRARPTRSRWGMSDRDPASPRPAVRNARPKLSSPAGCAAIPRASRKFLPAVLHFISAQQAHPIAQSTTGTPGGARRPFPILSTAIEIAMGAARQHRKEHQNG